MKKFLEFVEGLIGETLPFTLIVLGGFLISLKGGFFQLKGLIRSFKLMKLALTAPRKKGEITSFSAACTALSSTVGTGNIAGVAGALSLGGAGAVFWMWVSSFAGMAVKFGEISLSVKYRRRVDGKEVIGGPMYYISANNPKFKPLSMLFALAALPAVICSGCITQTNAAATALGESGLLKYVVGVSFFLFTPIVILGGVKGISAFTEKTVPFMSGLYILMSLGVILLNYKNVPTAFEMIFKGAFSPRAVTGGAVGSVMQAAVVGASRGVFSNEAGLGTSAMAHSTANDANAQTQGYYGIFEIFVDTIVLCTLTALTILCSGVNIDYGSVNSSQEVGLALKTCYGDFSAVLLFGMMCIFAFSSVIGWAFYGHICSGYAFGKKGQLIFKIIYPFCCIVGALCRVQVAWRLSAFFNGIMLCINVPAVMLMSKEFIPKGENGFEKKDKGNTKYIKA